MKLSTLATGLLCLTLFSACKHKDEATLAPPARPMLLIPGMLGSFLKKGDKLIWGNSISVFPSFYEGLRMPTKSWEELDTATAGEIVSDFEIFSFLPSIPHYKPTLDALTGRASYKLGENLFVYSYDWRNDLGVERERLRAYLVKLAEKNPEIDIFAISLGGLITLEALADWNAPLKVKTFFSAGVPLKGSPVMQRVLHLPRRRALRPSSLAHPSLIASFRSTYYLMPSRPLYKLYEKEGGDPEFSFLEAFDDGRNTAKSEALEWMDASFASELKDFLPVARQTVDEFRKKWGVLHEFPSVEASQVFGSSCAKTFGIAGDNTVTAESIEAVALQLKTRPTWVCAGHEKIQYDDNVLDNIIYNTRLGRP